VAPILAEVLEYLVLDCFFATLLGSSGNLLLSMKNNIAIIIPGIIK
jgi:hypothetical protein